MHCLTTIISRGRAGEVSTLDILPGTMLTVPAAEANAYRIAYPDVKIHTIPDKAIGISKTRNAVLDSVDEECVIMLDDDLLWFNCICRLSPFRLSPDEILTVLNGAAMCAKDAEATIFGFANQPDVRHFKGYDPFGINGWIEAVIGVVGRSIRWDEKLTCKCDTDACLQCLADTRFIWRDLRYAAVHRRETNSGGTASLRSRETIQKEMDYLKHKWGDAIKFKSRKISQMKTLITTKRRQTIHAGS